MTTPNPSKKECAPSPTDWEKRWDAIDQATWLGRSQHPEPFVVKAFIREIESAAYRRGKNDAVDYICKNSEEAVHMLFYVTNTTLEEARTKEPFDKK